MNQLEDAVKKLSVPKPRKKPKPPNN
jgi:hypothetical protein